jgi:hypothetical protein
VHSFYYAHIQVAPCLTVLPHGTAPPHAKRAVLGVGVAPATVGVAAEAAEAAEAEAAEAAVATERKQELLQGGPTAASVSSSQTMAARYVVHICYTSLGTQLLGSQPSRKIILYMTSCNLSAP